MGLSLLGRKVLAAAALAVITLSAPGCSAPPAGEESAPPPGAGVDNKATGAAAAPAADYGPSPASLRSRQVK